MPESRGSPAWLWQPGLPLTQSWKELGTMWARGWLDVSYPCKGGLELNTSWGLFVCTLTKGKESPGEELQGEGIGWVLFPEGLEQLQEAPSAPPGKLDITRLLLGVAVPPPPPPHCLIRVPKLSSPLSCSAATGTPLAGRAARPSTMGSTEQTQCDRDTAGDAQRDAGMGHVLSKGVPWVHCPPVWWQELHSDVLSLTPCFPWVHTRLWHALVCVCNLPWQPPACRTREPWCAESLQGAGSYQNSHRWAGARRARVVQCVEFVLYPWMDSPSPGLVLQRHLLIHPGIP